MTAQRDRELIARYLDGLATEAEAAELSHRLEACPEAAAAFARASRLDAWLDGHYSQEKGASGARAIVQRLAATLRVRRLAWRAAGIAAALLVALALAVWLWPAAPANRVLEGQVLAAGAAVRRIPYGTPIRIPGPAPAAIGLGDGSRATLEPATAATLRGPSGPLRILVELEAGGGTFQVCKAPGKFEVRTPVGSVTALGTEFSVRLLPRTSSDGKGVKGMRARGMLLAVAVLAGAVEVQVGDKALVLAVGQSQVFAGDEAAGLRTSRIGGELANVGADSITVIQRSDSGEKARTFAVDAQTKVVIESDQVEQVKGEGGSSVFRVKLIDGTLADLKPGRRATVTFTQDDKAILIVLNRVAPRREGGEGEKPRRQADNGDREGEPKREKVRTQGGEGEKPRRQADNGDREGEPKREKVRTQGGEGEGAPRTEKPRREGGEGEKPRRQADNGDREGEPKREKVRTEGGEGEGAPRTEKPRREGGDAPAEKPRITTGVIVGVRADSIVVAVGGEREGQQTVTFTVDANTKIGIQGERLEGGGEGADPIKHPALLPGTLADLRAGQRVSVQATPDGKALRIFVHRQAQPRRDGEGGEKKRFRLPEGGDQEGGERKPPRREGGGDRG